MLIDNVDDFSIWLVKELKELCEADPFTLSKYVIALLKKDKSESNLKKICNEQLNVFLLDKTVRFVDSVFECLNLKSYMPITKSERNPTVENNETVITKSIDTLNSNILDVSTSENKNSNDVSKDNFSGEDCPDLRKISPRFRDISDDEDKKNMTNRSYSKRSLDYSGHRSSDESRKKRRYNDDVDVRDRRRHSSRHRSHKSKRHVLDRIEHVHKNYERSDDSKLMSYSNEPKQWNVKTSCPDFVEKGVCLKGDSCEFDHGTNIVRSDLNCLYTASGISQVNVNPNWSSISMNQPWVDYPVSKQNKNLVQLKTIDQKSDQRDYRHNSKNNSHNSDIYDPSHPEIDAKNDSDSRTGQNDQAPVYVPSKVESIQKESSWWHEVDEASINNNTSANCEGSQVTTVIGSGKNRSRRTVSPIKRGRFTNTSNNSSSNFNPSSNYNNNNNYNNSNNNYNNQNNNYNNNNYNNNNRNNNNNNNKFNKRIANARCLLVTHIPIDCNDEIRLKQHFRAFGSITDVEVRFQNDPQHALIEFATVEEAKVAFRSPLPILDNRFIRTSLFSRPGDSNNLKVCKDSDDNIDSRDRRQVVQYKADSVDKERESDDEMPVDKWPQHSQSSDEEHTVVVRDAPKSTEKKSERWPVYSELKLDRRSNPNSGSTEAPPKDHSGSRENLSKLPTHQREEKMSRITEAQIERQKKLKEIADRKELDVSIDRLEESVQSYKNRLRSLLAEQKNPECDKDLVKRQLIESYNYYKELREMHESLKKKRGPRPEMSEIDKLKLKIKNIQLKLADMEKDSDDYKKQLRMITELKRDLVKLQSSTKTSKPNRLPSLLETKLDNRPKTLYITGPYCSHTMDDVRHHMKKYLVEKIERSDNDCITAFVAVKFKTRNEADRMVFEMGSFLKEKGSTTSFDRPIQICDPLDFKTIISDTQRGTPRDNCASSDDDDNDNESKIN